MNSNYKLTSHDQLTQLAKRNGIETWNALTEFIRNLPYGRNSNRNDLSLVLAEGKGTCSSKHALLKRLADLNNIPHIDLVVGIYKMTELNTPNIGKALTNNSIDFIPEAHCYLKINGIPTDFTSKQSDFKRIENDIIQEQYIEPHQVSEFKVDYHKTFIKRWLKDTKSDFEFDQIWQIREQCIGNLTS